MDTIFQTLIRFCLFFLLFFSSRINAQTLCIDSSLITNLPCPAVYDPVCGCDGVTYGNSCEAQNNGGVTSWAPGVCDNTPCPGNCQFDIEYFLNGTSLHAQLTPPQDTPPFFFYTLWSLDGGTVTGNGSDFAYLFNEPGRHVLCATYPTGDFSPETCTVCKAFDVTTLCVDTAQIDLTVPCPLAYIPVCGCDGVTYGNACEAFNYGGVNSWTPGICGSICNNLFIDFEGFNSGGSLTVWTFNDLSAFPGGTVNSWFWEFGNGQTSFEQNPTLNLMDTGEYKVCLTVSGQADDGTQCGTTLCKTIHVGENLCIDPALIDPTIFCPAVYEPVCGCNGVTYPNSCVAQYYNGVTSWTPGICPTNCLQPAWIDTLTPCIEIYDPVCGCDEVTYDNECFALTHGITAWTKGVCCPNPDCNAFFTLQILPNRTVLLSDSSYSAESWHLEFGDGGNHFGYFDSLLHTYATPGIYQICLSISNFAGDCSSKYCTVVDFSNTSTQEPENPLKMLVIPNPVRDWALVHVNGAIPRRAVLYDIFGQKVLEMPVSSSEFEIVLAGQPTGLYLLNVETEKGNVVRKVMVVN